nr:butyrate kinase [Clostridium acetireducens]
MMKKNLILVINPGSTSTKIAVFKGEDCIYGDTLLHDSKEINRYETIYAQKEMRTSKILTWIKDKKLSLKDFCAIVGRGGLIRPLPGGTYKVTPSMIEDLKVGYQGQHASNLGGIIAYEIATDLNIHAFVVDPVSVDEMEDIARISGMPEIERKSLGHPLNIKAVTRYICDKLDKEFYNSSYVVVHLGGGISVVPVKCGKIIDVNNANEEGPFSPERVGGLPTGDVVRLAFSKKYTYKEFQKKIIGKGGLVGYIGTNDVRLIEKKIDEGDKKAELVLKAMAYQTGKEIGAMAAVLKGQVDAIILTGGISHSKRIVNWITNMVNFIAPIEVMPGEMEMLALAQGALRIINNKEKVKIYEEEVHLQNDQKF